jgi:alkaline phosphatase D
MANRFDRREFIRIVAASAVVASAGALAACDDDPEATSPDMGPTLSTAEVFPLGLASGDPHPASVILWTRVEPADAAEPVEVVFEVASDEGFAQIIATDTLTAHPEADHTVRVKVTELAAYTHYWYRFTARGVQSVVGRTKTAPAPDQDVPIALASTSCQDYNGRYYHAWKVLVEQEADLDYVVFLGDYIYETAGDTGFQDQGGRQVSLTDGLQLSENAHAALTLADYRGLYKQYRSDPDLQRAHQLFPFIAIWDDHEFANDAWQDHSTHFNEAQGDEKSTDRRMAANQAWFEYMPADVVHDANAMFPDDLRITRSLRLGRHCELFMTDERSFRDDHVVPEGPPNIDVGKLGVNSSLGARSLLLKSGFDPIEAAAAPTMLGAEQKAWLIEGLTGSTATWKFWASEVQTAQQLVDLSELESLPESFRNTFYLSVDQWDGYRTERAEILTATAAVENMVILAGDIHAFYASEVQLDFDAPGEPVAVELVCAGISSKSYQEIIVATIERDEVLSGLGLVEVAQQLDVELAGPNPHLKHSQSAANGYLRIDITAAQIIGTFVKVDGITEPVFGGSVSRSQLTCASGSNRLLAG